MADVKISEITTTLTAPKDSDLLEASRDDGGGAWTTTKARLLDIRSWLAGFFAPLSHVGAGGAAHPAATTSVAGFMGSGDKTKLDGVATNANNYSHPNHTGEVTSAGDGAQTIAAGAVTNAKMATDAIATANVQNLAVTNPKLAADAVTNSKIADNAVGNPELANMPANTIKLRVATAGDPTDSTIAGLSDHPTPVAGDKLLAQKSGGDLVSIDIGALPSGSSPLTTKGDIFTRDASADARLAVGPNGNVLMADSSEATGQKWEDPQTFSPTTTDGDLIQRSGATDVRVPTGTTGQVLTVQAGGLWAAQNVPGGGGGITKGDPFVAGDLMAVESSAGDGSAESVGFAPSDVARLSVASQTISASGKTTLGVLSTTSNGELLLRSDTGTANQRTILQAAIGPEAILAAVVNDANTVVQAGGGQLRMQMSNGAFQIQQQGTSLTYFGSGSLNAVELYENNTQVPGIARSQDWSKGQSQSYFDYTGTNPEIDIGNGNHILISNASPGTPSIIGNNGSFHGLVANAGATLTLSNFEVRGTPPAGANKGFTISRRGTGAGNNIWQWLPS